MSDMTSLTITPRGPFSLAAAERFFGRWEASSGTESSAVDGGALRVAFLVDDWSGAAGLTVRQAEPGGSVEVEVVGGTFQDVDRVLAQVTRVFSLDHDGSGYAQVGERDAVIGKRQRDSDFLRPVLFHSPYEAACWGIISARMHHTQARAVRASLSSPIEVDGVELDVFASPTRLLGLTEIGGCSAEKVTRLHGVARAALEGVLDRDRLLALEPQVAMDELRALRGIGPFSSALIVLRGVGPTDGVAADEPRVRKAVAAAYDRPELEHDAAAFAALADTWRPFGTWVSVLMRATAAH
jgi:DNA-3-methyladenine glycosylase II